jgi:hypothetical protein
MMRFHRIRQQRHVEARSALPGRSPLTPGFGNLWLED